jgi:hypothetical protein
MFRSLYPVLRTENILLLRHNPQRGNKYIETCSWFVFSTRVKPKTTQFVLSVLFLVIFK